MTDNQVEERKIRKCTKSERNVEECKEKDEWKGRTEKRVNKGKIKAAREGHVFLSLHLLVPVVSLFHFITNKKRMQKVKRRRDKKSDTLSATYVNTNNNKLL